MASYRYNPFSSESSLSQWNRYLQQSEFHDDLKSAIKSQAGNYQADFERASSIVSSSIDSAARQQSAAIDDAARRQAEATARAADAVVGTLERGFSDLSSSLSDINYSVEQVGKMLDWGLSAMIDQQRISNLLLENVAHLLRIPDVQKERQYYIEQGFKHYKNATLDKDFYQDALENLLEAEKREKTDYVVLHRIGLIYLYAPKLIDLAKAEEYLRRTAKYASVDSDPNAHRIFNILAGDVTQKLTEQSTAVESIKPIVAESYFQAGVACYAQGKFADAVELSGKAYALLPTMLEAGFLLAKSLAASGDESQAADSLESIIKAERFYAVKTAADGDLAPKSKVQSLLLCLRDDAVKQAKDRIAKCKEMMLPNSQVAPLIPELEKLARRDSYLDALAALDGLTRERIWKRSTVDIFAGSSKLEQILLNNDFDVQSIAFSFDGGILAAGGYEVALLHIHTGHLMRVPNKDSRSISRIAVNPNRMFFASESESAVLVWNMTTGEILHSLSAAPDRFYFSTNFSPDGNILASYSNYNVRLWDSLTGELMQTLVLPSKVTFKSSNVGFSPDGKMFAAIDYKDTLRLWDVLSGSVLHAISCGNAILEDAVFSPDSKTVATFSADGKIKLWNTLTGDLSLTLPDEHHGILAFSPDGTMLAIRMVVRLPSEPSHRSDIQLWDVNTCKLIHTLMGVEGSGYTQASFSQDGTMLVAGFPGALKLFGTITGEVVRTFSVYSGQYVLSSDSTKLASTVSPKAVQLWAAPRMSLESFIQVEKEDNRRKDEINRLKSERAKQQAEEAQRQVEADRRRQDQIDQLMAQAQAEYEQQNKKWFGKNYSQVVALYEQAASLGSEVARKRVQELKVMMK